MVGGGYTYRKLREARQRSGCGYTEPTRGELQKSEKGSEMAIVKEKKEVRKRTVRKIREQGGTSCMF